MTMLPNLQIFGLVKFTIPKTDVVHPKSGLILHYLSEYRPANKIITFTVTIPMYSDMCYLLPSMAMGKIAECQVKEMTIRELRAIKDELDNNKTLWFVQNSKSFEPTISASPNSSLASTRRSSTVTPVRSTTSAPKRKSKRFIPMVIAIGSGIASTVMSAVNLLQTGSLKAEMRGVKESLPALHLATLNNEAQIVHVKEGQFELAIALRDTQTALNTTMKLVNQHSGILNKHTDALRTIVAETIYLKTKLDNVTHAIETHFIHQSMEDILSNKLNLHFVHHRDLPKVVYLVSQAMNLSLNDVNSSIPVVEIITRLLVRQQIDFAPTNVTPTSKAGAIIGKLIFTSYFAAPDQDQAPFSIYEVVPIPFNQGKKRVKLAQMPAFLGIESISQQFIRWSKEEAVTCDLVVMPSCREFPVRRKEMEDDCIYQILTDSKLTDCRIESFNDKVFIRRVGQHWLISTYNSSKCHSVTSKDSEQHILIDNEEITLPEVVLITTDSEKSLACDRFIIPKSPVKLNKSINLIYNESIKPVSKELINLQEALANETHWEKLPYISSDMQVIIDMITSTLNPIRIDHLGIWSEHPLSMTLLMIVGLLMLIIIISILYTYHIKRTSGSNTRITIALPSMKELEAQQE